MLNLELFSLISDSRTNASIKPECNLSLNIHCSSCPIYPRRNERLELSSLNLESALAILDQTQHQEMQHRREKQKWESRYLASVWSAWSLLMAELWSLRVRKETMMIMTSTANTRRKLAFTECFFTHQALSKHFEFFNIFNLHNIMRSMIVAWSPFYRLGWQDWEQERKKKNLPLKCENNSKHARKPQGKENNTKYLNVLCLDLSTISI